MNLLITGAWDCTKQQVDDIKRLGHEIALLQQEKDELTCNYEWVEGVICNGLFLFHDISKFLKLRFIQTTSAGLDRIPLAYCNDHNIVVMNAKGVYSIPMAEFAISGVLDIYKKRFRFYEHQKQKQWVKERELLELTNKSVLIVGCGSVGKECAKRFEAFGCNVFGVDVSATSSDHFIKIYPISELGLLLSTCDIVLISLPLTEKTKNLFDDNNLSLMKDGSILVNISRGGIVDENSLARHLDMNIRGAVIDVFLDEPLAHRCPLWGKTNVLISPHNSFVGDGNALRLTNLIFKNLEKHGGS